MPKKKPNMDKKSANNGDIIKHCSLAEVLTRCSSNWNEVHFSETHAGAGTYDARKQGVEKQFIAQLRAKVHNCKRTGSQLGETYLSELQAWWSDKDNH